LASYLRRASAAGAVDGGGFALASHRYAATVLRPIPLYLAQDRGKSPPHLPQQNK